MNASNTTKSKTIIVSNSAKCLVCHTVIYSAHRHDYQTCACLMLSVDGGQDYIKRSYVYEDKFQDISIVLNKKLIDDSIRLVDFSKDNRTNVMTVLDTLQNGGIRIFMDGVDVVPEAVLMYADSNVTWARENNRNTFGMVMAIIRAFRDAGMIIIDVPGDE